MSATGRQYSTPPEIPGLQFVQPLGKGGYADVFLYEQQMPRMKVAVKVLMAEGLTDAVRLQFTAEGNAMAELADHPYIVQVFRAGIADDGRPYLLMKYYPLPNLGVRSRREQIPVSEVMSIGIDICSAVETAHRAGILHRDIKPANILTGQYGAPGLTDFGIAATKASAEQTDPEGMSIPWSPPEVLFATSPADERSDVYAMAATLWHLLVGRSPFEVVGGDNSSLALMRRIHDAPAPRTGRPDVPASLERLLQQAMAKDPSLRPRSALDLARALQGVEQEQGLPLTKIVVSADVFDQNYATDDTEDATRVRAPVQISAQPIVQPQYSRQAPSHAPPVAPSRQQPLHPAWQQQPAGWQPASAGESDQTAPRPVSAPAESPHDTGVPAASGVRPAWILAGVAVLAVIGIIIGIIVTSGGDKNPKAQQTVSSEPTDTNALIVGPPGQPTVTAKRLDPNHVRFSWTYDNVLGDDSFKYTVTPSGSGSGTSTKPTVDLPTGPKQRLCLSVVVYRNSGASMSDPSAQVCSP
jgi:serine/threonine protein kinase